MRADDLHVVLLTRAVFPLHGSGGLERHVHDLVRHLARRSVRVTVITRPPTVPARSRWMPWAMERAT